MPLRSEIELDQIFSDELAEDVVVIRGESQDTIRAIVIAAGQEVARADGLSVGKRAFDLLVMVDQYIIGKQLEAPEQNDSFVLCDGTQLQLHTGPNGTFEWEVINEVYRITTTLQ